MPISKAATMIALVALAGTTLPAAAVTSHAAKRHHQAAKAAPAVEPERPAVPPPQATSSNAAENGIGGAGTLNSGGFSFLGPAAGGIGH